MSGFTNTHLKQSGTEPVWREAFNIWIMYGINSSIQYFNNIVGKGSKSQCLEGLLEIKDLTSSSVTSSNISKWEPLKLSY